MMRLSTLLAAAVIFAGGTLAVSAQPAPPPEGAPQSGNPYAQSYPASATPAPSPAMLAQAKRVFAELQSGKIDPSQMATGPNTNFTNATVTNAQKMVGSLGKPVSFVQQQSGSQGGVQYAIYVVTFKNGQTVDFLYAVDQNGKIAGLSLGSPK
jgi:hypothetical protein